MSAFAFVCCFAIFTVREYAQRMGKKSEQKWLKQKKKSIISCFTFMSPGYVDAEETYIAKHKTKE